MTLNTARAFLGIAILLTTSEQANEQSSKKLVLPASKRRIKGQIQGGIRATHNIVASGERMGGQRLSEKVSLSVCGRCRGGKKSGHVETISENQPCED